MEGISTLRQPTRGNGELFPKPKPDASKKTKSAPPSLSPETREALIARLKPEALAKRERALRTYGKSGGG